MPRMDAVRKLSPRPQSHEKRLHIWRDSDQATTPQYGSGVTVCDMYLLPRLSIKVVQGHSAKGG